LKEGRNEGGGERMSEKFVPIFKELTTREDKLKTEITIAMTLGSSGHCGSL
jgi:hypothetical protein